MKAWTIIGMLVALAVLGVVAAVVMPRFLSKTDDSPMGKVVSGQAGVVCVRGTLFTVTAEGIIDQPLLDGELKVMKC